MKNLKYLLFLFLFIPFNVYAKTGNFSVTYTDPSYFIDTTQYKYSVSTYGYFTRLTTGSNPTVNVNAPLISAVRVNSIPVGSTYLYFYGYSNTSVMSAAAGYGACESISNSSSNFPTNDNTTANTQSVIPFAFKCQIPEDRDNVVVQLYSNIIAKDVVQYSPFFYLNNTLYYSTNSTEQSIQDALNQQILQNQQVIEEQEKTNQNLQDLNSSLNNDNVDGAQTEADDLFNNDAFKDESGLDSIIKLPLDFINQLGSTCQPLNLNIPFFDAPIEIPCMQAFLKSKMPELMSVVIISVNGFVIYRILIDILGIIKSAKNPEDDRLDVVDL